MDSDTVTTGGPEAMIEPSFMGVENLADQITAFRKRLVDNKLPVGEVVAITEVLSIELIRETVKYLARPVMRCDPGMIITEKSVDLQALTQAVVAELQRRLQIQARRR